MFIPLHTCPRDQSCASWILPEVKARMLTLDFKMHSNQAPFQRRHLLYELATTVPPVQIACCRSNSNELEVLSTAAHSHTYIDKADNMVHPFACFKPCQVKDTTKIESLTASKGEGQQARFVLLSSALFGCCMVTAVHAPLRALILSRYTRCLMAFMILPRPVSRIIVLPVPVAARLQQFPTYRAVVICVVLHFLHDDKSCSFIQLCVCLWWVWEPWNFMTILSEVIRGCDHISIVLQW
jgi:hypothetical protein